MLNFVFKEESWRCKFLELLLRRALWAKTERWIALLCSRLRNFNFFKHFLFEYLLFFPRMDLTDKFLEFFSLLALNKSILLTQLEKSSLRNTPGSRKGPLVKLIQTITKLPNFGSVRPFI